MPEHSPEFPQDALNDLSSNVAGEERFIPNTADKSAVVSCELPIGTDQSSGPSDGAPQKGIFKRIERAFDKTAMATVLAATLGGAMPAYAEEAPPHTTEATLSTTLKQHWEMEKGLKNATATLESFHAALSAAESISKMKQYDSATQPNIQEKIAQLEIAATQLRKMNYAEVSAGINFLKSKLQTYPKALRTEAVSDADFANAMRMLNGIAAVTPMDESKLTRRTNPSLLIKDLIARAREAAIGGVFTFQDELINGAKQKAETGDMQGVEILGALFSSHVANVTRAVEDDKIQDSERVIGSVSTIASKVYAELPPQQEPYRAYKKGGILGFLAKAGHKEGTQLLAEKLAKKELSFDDVHGLFSDDYRPSSRIRRSTINEGMNRGGEMVTRELFRAYNVPAESYLPYWKESLNSLHKPHTPQFREKAMQIYNKRLRNNAMSLVALESKERGSLAHLTANYGIRFPGRYPVEILHEQLSIKKGDAAPFGISVAPLTDHNGAFDEPRYYGALFDQAKKINSTVRVIEGGSGNEIGRHMLRYIDRMGGKKAEFVSVSGHGQSDNIEMSNAPDGRIKESFFGAGPNRTSLVLDGPILFNSCSTGVPSGIAEKISRDTSSAVLAPDKDAFITQVELGRNSNTGKVDISATYASPKKMTVRVYVNGKEVKVNGSVIPSTTDTLFRD